MAEFALIVVPILIAAAAAILAVYYLRYSQTPAAQWKRRVRAAAAAVEAQLHGSQTELSRLARTDASRALRNEFFNRHLAGMAVEELIRFPGIGPVTASKVRDAGLTNLAALDRANLTNVPGIGPARAKDLRDAIRQLRREAESQFDAGACPEAVSYAEAQRRHEAERQTQRQAAEQSMRHAKTALAALQERLNVARGITLFGYILRRPPAGLTVELMNQPLAIAIPVLEPKPEVIEPATVPSIALAPAKQTPPPVDSTPMARLRAVAVFGLAVAKSDSRIAASERRQVRAFVARRYAQDADLANEVDSIIAESEAEASTLHDALREIRRVIPTKAWPEIYQFAVSIADSAGERNTREIECLARIAEELGIGIEPKATPLPPPTLGGPAGSLTEIDCRAALEIAADTPLSVDLIRRQYRLLSVRFEPEKFGSHGPEFIAMAAEKRDKVERAARHLLAEYNEPLEPAVATAPTDLRHNPDLDDFFGA